MDLNVRNDSNTDVYNIFNDTNAVFTKSNTDTKSDHKYLSTDQKLKIINLPLRWKNYMYKTCSKRYRVGQTMGIPREPNTNIEYEKNVYFSCLNGFAKYPIISVDGVNGVGKSTLTQRTNRKYCKINLIHPEITEGQDYNIKPLHSFEYIMSQCHRQHICNFIKFKEVIFIL